MTNQKLLFINNSENPVFFRLLLDTTITYETYVSEINSHDSIRPLFANKGKNTWEFKINNESIDSSLYIYVFNPERKNIVFSNPRGIKIKDLNYDFLGNRNFAQKRFKINDLERLNWIINYPKDFE
jgi:hypothetical protein